MNATAELNEAQDATTDSSAVPILMRLPDLRDVASLKQELPAEVAQPAAITQVASPTPEPPVAAAEASTPAALPRAETSPQKSEATAPLAQKANASSAAAVSRRDRAQERLRRQQVESQPKAWWYSKTSLMLIGFVVALAITLMLAKQKREQNRPTPETWVNQSTPELNIETEQAPALPVIETTETSEKTQTASALVPPAATLSAAPTPESESAKRVLKTPPLLSQETAAKTDPPAAEEKPREASADSTAANAAEQYPTTNASEYQPSNRVAQTPEKPKLDSPSSPSPSPPVQPTDAPMYPVTNFPSTWR
jgi:hypothetical protein